MDHVWTGDESSCLTGRLAVTVLSCNDVETTVAKRVSTKVLMAKETDNDEEAVDAADAEADVEVWCDWPEKSIGMMDATDTEVSSMVEVQTLGEEALTEDSDTLMVEHTTTMDD